MSWRSSYLFCPECMNVYFANQIKPVVEHNSTAMACPNALCEGAYGLVTIDELMIKPIVLLNEAGYVTNYCCSGHELRDDATEYGYILFGRGIKIPYPPTGWKLETDRFGRACIRSEIPELVESISNLNKWVYELIETEEKGE